MGQPSDRAAVPGPAVSTQLEAATPSPWRAHSSAFAEAEEEGTECALPWQRAVTVSLVVPHHALASTSAFGKV